MPNWNSKLLNYTKYAIIAVVVGSFIFFGVYEAITSTQNYVAKIDGTKITTQEYSNYINQRRTDILAGAMENKLVYTQALEFVESAQFSKIILNEMVNKVVIHKFLIDNNIKVTHKTVAEYIKTINSFQKDGKFNSRYFQQYLEYQNISEYEFLSGRISQIEQMLFEQMVSATKIKSNILANKYSVALKKERNIETLTLKSDKDFAISQDALNKIYEQNKEKFIQKPQHFVLISYIDDYIKQNVSIFSANSQEIANYYNENFTGSVVDFYFAKFSDEKSAQTAQLIAQKQGISLRSVVDAMKKQGVNVSGGDGNSEKMENKSILYGILNLKTGNVTNVIFDDKSYFVAQILKIHEPTRVSTDGSKAQELAQQRKCYNSNIYIEKIKLELNSGASFESVALKYGFPLSAQVRVDTQTGDVFDTNTNIAAIIDEKLKSSIIKNMDTQYGNIVTIDEKICSYAVYQQSRVEPQRFKTLDEVRGRVISIYIEQKKLEDITKIANRIVSQVISQHSSLSSYPAQGVIENRNVSILDAPSKAIFKHKVGDAFYFISRNESNENVAIVVKINADNTFSGIISDDELASAQNNIMQVYYSVFSAELMAELYKKYGVKVRPV